MATPKYGRLQINGSATYSLLHLDIKQCKVIEKFHEFLIKVKLANGQWLEPKS